MPVRRILAEQPLGAAGVAAVIVGLVLAPSLLSESAIISLITFLLYATLAVSWNMFSGATGRISLATAALFGCGVYLASILRGHMPIELIMLSGAVAAALLAALIGVLTLRLRGVYFILFTFGITALIENSVQWWETNVNGTVGRHVKGATTDTVYLLIAVVFALTLITAFLLKHSKWGHALLAIRDNEDAAAHIGIDVTRIKVATFAASALFMGAAGAIMATRWRYIEPLVAFNPLTSFLPVLMAIFGGLSRLWGVVLGAVALTALRELLITEYPYAYLVVFGLTLTISVLFLPDGLVGLLHKVVPARSGGPSPQVDHTLPSEEASAS